MIFKHFTESDYDAVCEFLIELNSSDNSHINWNWARFEWMYEHPEFDKGHAEAIGLWIDEDKVVGAAIFDTQFGEGLCAVLPGYQEIYSEVLEYAFNHLSDDSGFSLAVCDDSEDEKAEVLKHGFVRTEQTENVMELDLARKMKVSLPQNLRFVNPDPVEDAQKLQWLFWQGFDHGEDRSEFEKEESIVPKVRKHFNRELCVAACDPDGQLVSICGLWYSERTDYVYLEPVCTIPRYRGKGVARAVIYEALNRAKALGAQKAYVISDMDFYRRLGFKDKYRYTFYRMKISESEKDMTEEKKNERKVAQRKDWKTEPMPEMYETFVLNRSFSDEEMDVLRLGSVPKAMEDKWFWYMEGSTLYAHRSWTGNCIYQIEFKEDDNHVVTVNRDPEQYKCTSIEKDIENLNELLDWWTETPYDYYNQWLSEISNALGKTDKK